MVRSAACLMLIFSCLLFFSCANKSKSFSPPGCNNSQKIPVLKEFVFDLSGYEGSGGSSPYNLFDENYLLDPKNGITDPAVTSPQPVTHPDIYFSKGKGNRIVVDLRVPFNIGDVYVYDRSEDADSVWIYTGNMNDMKLKVAFVTKGDPSLWGWRKFSIQDSSRYVMIRFNSWRASVNEMVMYGCPTQALPPEPSSKYSGQRLPAKTLKEFLGVNMYTNPPIEWLQPFSAARMYTIANTFDMDTVNAYPNNKISISRYGYLFQQDTFRHFSDEMQKAGKLLWYSVRGVPVWMNKRNMWDHDRPVTNLGMDPEDPMSYGRHANMMWTLAAVFGKTKVDSQDLNISDMIKVSGKGTMTLFENGNEEDAWWAGNLYCSPMEYFAQSSADLDGNEGKLGAKHGIMKADSNSKLIMSGMIEFDTARLKVLNFLTRNLRHDKKFIWQGGVQYHHYSTKLKNRSIFNRNKKTIAITPEEDSLRVKLTKVRDFTYRIDPTVDCILGEYGYDKSQASPQAAPLVPGYSSSQSQGIMLLRGINAVAFSGFDRLMIYWLKDDVDENDPNIYLTSGVLRQMPDGKIIPYPAWFYLSTLINRMGDYLPEKIISENADVWLYQYRNKSHADSLAYFIYSPTHNGKKSSYDLQVPAGSDVRVIEFSEGSTNGKEVFHQMNQSSVKIAVTEMPKMIFVVTGAKAGERRN